MNSFLDKNGNEVVGLLGSADDELDELIIRDKMLDGSYSVQMVGTAAKVLNVVFYCSRAIRRQIQLASAQGDLVTINWRDVTYIGYISDPSYEDFWPKKESRQNKVKFTLLVEDET